MEGSPSSALGDSRFKFDVFLSFRGKDTRKGFTGHLYDRLKLHGISAFKDSEDLERGQEIAELLNCIERSKMFMPVFSKGYAESKWCLKEITMMVACERLIIPVFFDVEPSEVCHQIKHFASAFKQYEQDTEMDQQEVTNWRRALETVCSFCGFHLKNDTGGDEAKLIVLIVKRLLGEVSKLPYQVAEHPTGIDAYVNEVKRKILRTNECPVQFIGIHGMGGIGKTTIAKAIYNELFLEFEASSFLFNIREKFQQHRELELLRQLAGEILKFNHPPIYSIEDGKRIIRNRMSSKRVLIILDDIEDMYQLDALAGRKDWFGRGSMIFITTRNCKVLEEHSLREGQIYKVNGLNYGQARYLFSCYAFKDRDPEKGCLQLLEEFVKAGDGIPLAIQVFGSTLSSKREVQQWEDILKKLRNIPGCLQQRLRVSYDGLETDEQKQIFLDISCFFVGKDRKKATHMWEACGFDPGGVIEDLRGRSLVNIDKNGEFSMHDLIRDMGREIVRQQGNTEPWLRSRLWNLQDITELLQRRVTNEWVKGIMLQKTRNDFEETEGCSLENRVAGQRSKLERCFSTQCFELMHTLRILHLEGISFEGSFQHFPKHLRWLALENCCFASPPHDFDLEKISVLDLSGCSIMAECFTNNSLTGGLVICNLKFLNLGRTEISTTPDFTNACCLEQLILRDCTRLTEVHESIGLLKSLFSLDLGGCKVLSKIPDSVGKLSSLKSFDLRNCGEVSSLPGNLGNMKSLEELYLDSTSIKTLPFSIRYLTRLRILSLGGCKRLEAFPSSVRFLCLQQLIVQHTFVSGLEQNICYKKEAVEVYAFSFELAAVLPTSLCRRISKLDLTDRTKMELPDSVEDMTNLSLLSLKCAELRGLPAYIGSMRRIKQLRLDCPMLESLPDSFGTGLRELVSLRIFCDKLQALPDSLGGLESLEILEIGCNSLTSLPHSIGQLESLRQLRLACEDLKVFPTSISSLTSLEILCLMHCHNLEMIAIASVPQQDSHQHSSSSQPLDSKRPDQQSGHTSPLQFPSSLLDLEARHCTQLREIDVSNLQSLISLNLEGSDLLDDILGLETIAKNLETLVLSSPACVLSSIFVETFKRTAFPCLHRLEVGSCKRNTRLDPLLLGPALPTLTDVPKEVTLPSAGVKDILHQAESSAPAISWVRRGRLPFLLPNVPHANGYLSGAMFYFNRLPSPINVSVIADDDRLLFETTRHLVNCRLELCSDDEIILRLRDVASGTIQVMGDMSSLSEFSAYFVWEIKRSDNYIHTPHIFRILPDTPHIRIMSYIPLHRKNDRERPGTASPPAVMPAGTYWYRR